MSIPQLKKIVGVVDKVCFQPELDEPYVTPIVSITPSTPTIASTSIKSDDEVDTQSFISSLSKLFEKNKSVKSLEKKLNSIWIEWLRL